MARSNKPVIWSLFAAGGTFAAFVTPVSILVSGLAVVFGLLSPEALAYERVLSVVQNPIGKAILFLVIFLPSWHAAHRLRITAHDFGIRADTVVKYICYGLATAMTIISIFVLLGI